MVKFYAVKKGKKTGIYNTWGDAEKQVKGYSGALYKSFSTKEDAENYLNIESDIIKNTITDITSTNELEAYVDGSFDAVTNIYGTGVVIIKRGNVVDKIFKQGNDDRFTSSYQIAGEVFGALEAMIWASNNHFSQLTIYYDYEGIEKWALGLWKANKPISKHYVESFKILSKGLNVSFKKVKAHSGNTYNELADTLAKKATKMTSSAVEIKTNPDLSERFLSVNGHKKNLYLNIEVNGKVWEATTIYKLLKSKWKKNGGKIGDIKTIKTIIEIDEKKISFQIETIDGDLKYIIIYGDELNG